MVSSKEPPTTGTSSVSAIIPSFCSTNLGIAKERRYDRAGGERIPEERTAAAVPG